jgi:PTH1 family peptidyl-tRNA hydrolase
MRVLVGLGNPGEQYLNTRHNAGFQCVDAVAKLLEVTNWSHFKGSLVADVRVGVEKVLLLKPQSFMNRSGEAIAQVQSYYSIPVANFCIATDDVYISPGSVRVRRGGGDGGHNGWRSIGEHVGAEEFWRVRLGVGVYEQEPDKRMHQPPLDEYVLQRMPQHDRDLLSKAIDKVVPNLIQFLEHGNLAEETVHI